MDIPDNIKWPKFEDGELVKVGDGFMTKYNGKDYSAIVDEITFKSTYFILSCGLKNFAYAYDVPVQRSYLMYDMDGVEIKVGDYVFDSVNGFVVEKLDYAQNIVEGRENDGLYARYSAKPSEVTHREPLYSMDNYILYKGDVVWGQAANESAPSQYEIKEFINPTTINCKAVGSLCTFCDFTPSQLSFTQFVYDIDNNPIYVGDKIYVLSDYGADYSYSATVAGFSDNLVQVETLVPWKSNIEPRKLSRNKPKKED